MIYLSNNTRNSLEAMKPRRMTSISAALIAMAIAAANIAVAKQKPDKRPEVPQVELTATGQELLARYSEQL